jgi:hypothetical protein
LVSSGFGLLSSGFGLLSSGFGLLSSGSDLLSSLKTYVPENQALQYFTMHD